MATETTARSALSNEIAFVFNLQKQFKLTPNETFVLLDCFVNVSMFSFGEMNQYKPSYLSFGDFMACMDSLFQKGLVEPISRERNTWRVTKKVLIETASDFDELWNVYPNGSKTLALQAYKLALLTKSHQFLVDARKRYVHRYKNSGKETYIVQLARFLKEEFYESIECQAETKNILTELRAPKDL